jgi:predicted dehydrogenase
MPKNLRWGLLGTARINHSLIPSLRATKRNQLVAVASRSLEKAQDYARTWKIPIAYGSYEALLDNPDIDVVYIPLPNHLHAEWAIKAAAAGKHVLCEKPLALSELEVDQIITAARTHHVHITEAFQYRHHPRTLKVKELIDAGEIGELRYIQGSFSYPLNRPEDYRWNPDQGGGSLWDVGCYPLSYAMLAAGAAPVEVMGWQKKAASGVDASFIGQLRFANDLLAQIQCSFEMHRTMKMELIGTTGTILIPTFLRTQNQQRVILQKERERIFCFRREELFRGEVENMAEVILDGQTPRLPLEESRQIIRCLTALYRSAQIGKPVML